MIHTKGGSRLSNNLTTGLVAVICKLTHIEAKPKTKKKGPTKMRLVKCAFRLTLHGHEKSLSTKASKGISKMLNGTEMAIFSSSLLKGPNISVIEGIF